jgi:hypothetical protein
MDELFAVLSAVKDGEVTASKAIKSCHQATGPKSKPR